MVWGAGITRWAKKKLQRRERQKNVVFLQEPSGRSFSHKPTFVSGYYGKVRTTGCHHHPRTFGRRSSRSRKAFFFDSTPRKRERTGCSSMGTLAGRVHGGMGVHSERECKGYIWPSCSAKIPISFLFPLFPPICFFLFFISTQKPFCCFLYLPFSLSLSLLSILRYLFFSHTRSPSTRDSQICLFYHSNCAICLAGQRGGREVGVGGRGEVLGLEPRKGRMVVILVFCFYFICPTLPIVVFF